ncbi:MAG: bifunctional demethylmenaquinone methyltransferase/2-methoxy-6-polyprenyl-1,4-benzoquinol methylase UbiE [Planctomycetales bacterium]|nr:bifunctional demethylmenaquinone methyltransferase/2-methoxy-6-polyprenyl-1,4-benzoquinol methylase UbiE [Planctomycetales bacterium]
MSTTVDKSGPRVRDMFGEIAGRYDFLNHLLSLNIDRYWRWRTVRIVPPAPGAKILDLCTGTGDLALAYHRAAGGKAQIIGADFCYQMLDIARQKAAKAGAGQSITFIEADAQQVPLDDNRFEIVCAAFGLRNVADTDAGLAEMTRVCAPGGQVAVLEFSTPDRQPFKFIYSWYFRHVLPRIGQLFSRSAAGAYNYLPASVGEFPQGEQLAARMRAAGLTDVTHRGLTLGIATLYVGTKRPEIRGQ